MATNQESKFISALNFTAQKGKTYNEAMQNMFQLVSGGDGTWNGDAINYLKDYLGSSQNNINALLNEFAVNLGFNNWDSCNNMGDPLLYSSNLKLWLDSGDSTTFTYGTSPKLSQWDDKSGNGNNFSQPTSVDQPTFLANSINNLDGININGVNEWMYAPSFGIDWTADDFTVFVVAQMDADGAVGFAKYRGIIGTRFGPGSGSWWTVGQHGFLNTIGIETSGGFFADSNFSAPGAGPFVTMLRKTGSGTGSPMELFINNVSLTSINLTASGIGSTANDIGIGRWLGADQGWKGEMGEFLVFNKSLSATEVKMIYDYLSKKWGI